MKNALSKLSNVDDSITIHRYDNGYMVEVSGRGEGDNWTTVKSVCTTKEEMFTLVEEYISMDME